ncbi:hypothetical protein Purlil1_3471 [Purpureocillium lilacinum]|uniref:Uncharacterized protein n=1 Tax=Purpureocillium lilacinum TaxID=33203 RepID=A0ABR0C767_PURLI|nr:hypothetical protein Purlil1_3471 [Purpureocillium lilacinum]
MKLQLALLSLVAAAVTAEDVQTAHLKFRAASSSETYDLAVKADGSSVDTDHADLSIHLIDAPDYLASSLCHFTTPQPVELSTTIADDNVTQQVVLDPPQPVLSVRCEGMCVGTYALDPNGASTFAHLEGIVEEGENWLMLSRRRLLRQQRPARRAVLQRALRREPLPPVEHWPALKSQCRRGGRCRSARQEARMNQ